VAILVLPRGKYNQIRQAANLSRLSLFLLRLVVYNLFTRQAVWTPIFLEFAATFSLKGIVFMYDELAQLAASTKYPVDAFIFIQRGLDFTSGQIHGQLEHPDDPESEHENQQADPMASRHVTGQQLCDGLREFAIEQYGLMARTVLRSWNITTCADFGNLVFAMVDAEMMQRTDHDTLDDFVDVYSFADAFAPRLQLNH
jgi:uncharacterized repeat protein (TIGR04138 family)